MKTWHWIGLLALLAYGGGYATGVAPAPAIDEGVQVVATRTGISAGYAGTWNDTYQRNR